MKLTPAEYKLLDELHMRAWSGQVSRNALCVRRDLVRRMRVRGLISERAWNRGYVVATELGKRSHDLNQRRPEHA
jgi:hypothetical protein